jgi:uncharacterized membrane protein
MDPSIQTDGKAAHKSSSNTRSFLALVRLRVTAGLITILPILITFWVIRFIFRLMRDASRWAVEAVALSPRGMSLLHSLGLADSAEPAQALEQLPGAVHWGIAITSVALTILLLYVVGALAANVAGRRAVELVDTFAARVPLVKSVYRASKQVLSTLGGDESRGYLGVALVPFPTDTMRAVGFITNRFQDAVTGEDLVSVFIPSTPNPTTGFLEVVRRADLVQLKWSVEDALATIMSGATVVPDGEPAGSFTMAPHRGPFVEGMGTRSDDDSNHGHSTGPTV